MDAPKQTLTRLDVAALGLAVAGALNWGSLAIANRDLVKTAVRGREGLAKVVYGLVGLAGAYGLWTAVKAGRQVRAA